MNTCAARPLPTDAEIAARYARIKDDVSRPSWLARAWARLFRQG